MKTVESFIPIFQQSKIFDYFENRELPKDDQGLFRPLEMILLPGSRVKSCQNIQEGVAQVTLDDGKSFFTLAEFFNSKVGLDTKPLNPQLVLDNLISYLGCPYVWGGNWVLDETSLIKLVSQVKTRQEYFFDHMRYLFSGIDCSGLLFASTYGQVPRNTSMLVNFGETVDIEGNSFEEILNKVRPLDILVWKGHVLIFLDPKTLIESRLGFGCVSVGALERLEEISCTRFASNQATDKSFVIKRWISVS